MHGDVRFTVLLSSILSLLSFSDAFYIPGKFPSHPAAATPDLQH
jgi:hypothetical protein